MILSLPSLTCVEWLKVRVIEKCEDKIASINTQINHQQVELKRIKLAREKLTWGTCTMTRDAEMQVKIEQYDAQSASICKWLSKLEANVMRAERRRDRLFDLSANSNQ